jgi:hypothetical protein
MSVPAHRLPRLDRDAERLADDHRRVLLAESDRLVTEIEELRLVRATQLPPLLRVRIRRLQTGMGRPDSAGPLTLRAAHHLLFALQQRLMSANPRRPTTAAQPGRPAGTPAVSPIRPGLTWKLLVLPPDPGPGRERPWLAAIDATLERALDRWAYAQHHAVRAARRAEPAAPALAVARVAWNNYWELLDEASRIRGARGDEAARN